MAYYTFASTYDSGAYGASTYETSAAAGSSGSTGTTGTGSGGVLTNTGFDVLVSVTVACVIIFATLVVRFWKRPVKQESTD